MHPEVLFYGVKNACLCGEGVVGIDIEWKKDEERGCGKDEDEDGKDI